MRWRDLVRVVLVIIRAAGERDWLRIYPFFSSIVAGGQTYAYPEGLSPQDARGWSSRPV